MNKFAFSEADLSARLAARSKQHKEPPYPEYPLLSRYLAEKYSEPPRPAAVLIPFLQQNSQWHLLFTRRNASLPEHSGQVAFPGGRADPDDQSPEQTALRETQEEIGILTQDVRVLGTLQPFLTISNYIVTPVVGVIPWPYPLRLEEREVSHTFTVPIEWLANPANHEERQRSVPLPIGPISIIYFQPYEGEILWGVSARLTLGLLEVLQD